MSVRLCVGVCVNNVAQRSIVAAVVLAAGFYVWSHRSPQPAASIFPDNRATQQSEESYDKAREADEMAAVSGPAANYMMHGKPVPIETLQAISYKPAGQDGRDEAPVGTSRPLLHKTFAVSGLVDIPFEVPAHAATPQLHGSFQSYPQPTDVPTGDGNPDVDFLVLSARQYADFLHGQPDAIFSADQIHDQDVNATLPPTMRRAVTYHLVFRGDGTAKKVVQADFRLDF